VGLVPALARTASGTQIDRDNDFAVALRENPTDHANFRITRYDPRAHHKELPLWIHTV
jgi:hypothetical protein